MAYLGELAGGAAIVFAILDSIENSLLEFLPNAICAQGAALWLKSQPKP